MRYFLTILVAVLVSGCSLFGTYVWLHPEKAESQQLADKSECADLSTIVYGSPEALLALAKDGKAKPNPRLEADCLAAKGYNQVFIPKQT